MQIDYNNPDCAFDKAIESGLLSRTELDSNYAGNYMYMGTVDDKDLFKCIATREYIKS